MTMPDNDNAMNDPDWSAHDPEIRDQTREETRKQKVRKLMGLISSGGAHR